MHFEFVKVFEFNLWVEFETRPQIPLISFVTYNSGVPMQENEIESILIVAYSKC
jgi:hypothetical protein